MGFFDKLFDKISGGNTLYYPGCLTKFARPELGDNYKNILRKAGIEFIELKDLEVCCGSPALNAGYDKDFKELGKRNLKIFKDHSVKKIITSCPACYKTFTQDYAKIEGWDIRVEHITITIENAIKKGKLKLKVKPEKVTFHDPCHLARHCKITKEPRSILKSLGLDVVEMRNHGEDTLCCGGGGGMKTNFPKVADKAAKNRAKQAKDLKVKKIITCCPLCKEHLKENSGKINVLELSEVIDLE